jgi:hypothetical protein
VFPRFAARNLKEGRALADILLMAPENDYTGWIFEFLSGGICRLFHYDGALAMTC